MHDGCCLTRQITKAALEVLQADELVRVNQDLLGIPGDLIWKQGANEVGSHRPGSHASLSLACAAAAPPSHPGPALA